MRAVGTIFIFPDPISTTQDLVSFLLSSCQRCDLFIFLLPYFFLWYSHPPSLPPPLIPSLHPSFPPSLSSSSSMTLYLPWTHFPLWNTCKMFVISNPLFTRQFLKTACKIISLLFEFYGMFIRKQIEFTKLANKEDYRKYQSFEGLI